ARRSAASSAHVERQRALHTRYRQVHVHENPGIEQRAMSLALGVVYAVTLAERIEAVALPGMQTARQRQRVEHLADLGDGSRFAQARELGVEKSNVEWRVVNDELGAFDERDQLDGNLRKLGRLRDPREVDAVHR